MVSPGPGRKMSGQVQVEKYVYVQAWWYPKMVFGAGDRLPVLNNANATLPWEVPKSELKNARENCRDSKSQGPMTR
jgi:hypothetical protein